MSNVYRLSSSLTSAVGSFSICGWALSNIEFKGSEIGVGGNLMEFSDVAFKAIGAGSRNTSLGYVDEEAVSSFSEIEASGLSGSGSFFFRPASST